MQHKEIEYLLPEIFRRTLRDGQPLTAVLRVMEELHTPSEALLKTLPDFLNPFTTPERYLPMLAHWINLEAVFAPLPIGVQSSPWAPRRLPMPADRLRVLIAAAAKLARWRGTTRGLREFLEIATGITGYVLDEQCRDQYARTVPFHLRVVVPQAARPQQELIERIVQFEKPAYVTWQLEFESQAAAVH